VLGSPSQLLVELGFESRNIFENVNEVISKAKSFDSVCDYILSLDQKESSSPDPHGIGKMIDEILEE
jgi:hypothetical protein